MVENFYQSLVVEQLKKGGSCAACTEGAHAEGFPLSDVNAFRYFRNLLIIFLQEIHR